MKFEYITQLLYCLEHNGGSFSCWLLQNQIILNRLKKLKFKANQMFHNLLVQFLWQPLVSCRVRFVDECSFLQQPPQHEFPLWGRLLPHLAVWLVGLGMCGSNIGKKWVGIQTGCCWRDEKKRDQNCHILKNIMHFLNVQILFQWWIQGGGGGGGHSRHSPPPPQDLPTSRIQKWYSEIPKVVFYWPKFWWTMIFFCVCTILYQNA